MTSGFEEVSEMAGGFAKDGAVHLVVSPFERTLQTAAQR